MYMKKEPNDIANKNNGFEFGILRHFFVIVILIKIVKRDDYHGTFLGKLNTVGMLLVALSKFLRNVFPLRQ